MNQYRLILCANKRDGYVNFSPDKEGQKLFICTLSDLRSALRNENVSFTITRTDSYRNSEWYSEAEKLLGSLSEIAPASKLFFVYINSLILPCKEWSIECASSIDGKWPENIPENLCVLIDIEQMNGSSLCLWCGNVRIERNSLFISKPLIVDPEQ